MEGSAGLPMSVSIMTPAFHDAKCLLVMKEVEQLVNFTAKPTAYKKKQTNSKRNSQNCCAALSKIRRSFDIRVKGTRK
jgi:hypothetical protein